MATTKNCIIQKQPCQKIDLIYKIATQIILKIMVKTRENWIPENGENNLSKEPKLHIN